MTRQNNHQGNGRDQPLLHGHPLATAHFPDLLITGVIASSRLLLHLVPAAQKRFPPRIRLTNCQLDWPAAFIKMKFNEHTAPLHPVVWTQGGQ